MDADVQKILEAAEQMKVAFKALEARKSLPLDRQKAIAKAANMFRFFEGTDLSLLWAAFDQEYKAELDSLNAAFGGKLRKAKNKII